MATASVPVPGEKAEKTFADIYAALDAALKETKLKKKAYDDAVEKVKVTNDEFIESSNRANELRKLMNRILDESIPAEQVKPKIG